MILLYNTYLLSWPRDQKLDSCGRLVYQRLNIAYVSHRYIIDL